jgi:hypothetical protein
MYQINMGIKEKNGMPYTSHNTVRSMQNIEVDGAGNVHRGE